MAEVLDVKPIQHDALITDYAGVPKEARGVVRGKQGSVSNDRRGKKQNVKGNAGRSLPCTADR